MKKSFILIALLVAIVSIGAVCAAANDTNVTPAPNPSPSPAENVTEDNNTDDIQASGDNITVDDANATGNVTNTTNTTVANTTNTNATASGMLETGLPVVALILVVLAAVGLYRRD